VQRLFAYYSDALEGIFTFYATSDKRSNAALAASAVKAGHVSGPYAASHGAMTVGGKSPSRATRSANTMKEVRRLRCAALLALRCATGSALCCVCCVSLRCDTVAWRDVC